MLVSGAWFRELNIKGIILVLFEESTRSALPSLITVSQKLSAHFKYSWLSLSIHGI